MYFIQFSEAKVTFESNDPKINGEYEEKSNFVKKMSIISSDVFRRLSIVYNKGVQQMTSRLEKLCPETRFLRIFHIIFAFFRQASLESMEEADDSVKSGAIYSVSSFLYPKYLPSSAIQSVGKKNKFVMSMPESEDDVSEDQETDSSELYLNANKLYQFDDSDQDDTCDEML